MISYSLKDNPIFYLGILITIEQGIGQGAVSLTHMIPAAWAPYVQNWCTTLAWIGGVIMTAFAAPGRVTAAPAVKVGLVLLALLMLWPTPASAQSRRPPALTGNPVQDIKNAVTGTASTAALPNENAALNALLKPFQDIATFIGGDNLAAAQLAVAIPELQDGNGLSCLNAMATAAKVIKLHPLPLTLHIMKDVEAFRLNVAAINKLCDNAACTVIFADGVNVAQAAAPVTIASLPSLSQLCAKVAHIQMATPAQVDLDQLKAETSAAAPATAPATPSTPAAPPNP